MATVMSLIDWSGERWAFIVMVFLTHEVPLLGYQLMISLFRTMDIAAKYRIQPKADIPVDLMSKAVTKILIGHLLIQPILLYFIYDLFQWRQVPSILSPLPGFGQSVLYIAICAILCDTGNY